MFQKTKNERTIFHSRPNTHTLSSFIHSSCWNFSLSFFFCLVRDKFSFCCCCCCCCEIFLPCHDKRKNKWRKWIFLVKKEKKKRRKFANNKTLFRLGLSCFLFREQQPWHTKDTWYPKKECSSRISSLTVFFSVSFFFFKIKKMMMSMVFVSEFCFYF